MKQALILVEGQTEERFVKDTLAPHLAAHGLYITPTLLTTKVVKNGPNFKGGVTSFDKFKADMGRLLGGAAQDWLVTMMLDYYRLPTDFPGMNTRPQSVDPFTRVRHVEQAITAHFNDGRFLPFLTLHEFEASGCFRVRPPYPASWPSPRSNRSSPPCATACRRLSRSTSGPATTPPPHRGDLPRIPQDAPRPDGISSNRPATDP